MDLMVFCCFPLFNTVHIFQSAKTLKKKGLTLKTSVSQTWGRNQKWVAIWQDRKHNSADM